MRAGKTEVIDCGVDLTRFALRDVAAARAEIGWSPEGTAFLCVGTLSERKNVLRLASAFEQRGEGELVFLGDGPLRPALQGRPGIRLVGPVPHDLVPSWMAASDVVCQPSLAEPFGLVTLEGMACGRTVVATRVGGPPEFVTDAGGVIVDPYDEDALGGRCRRRRGSRARTWQRGPPPRITTSGGRRSGWRRSSPELAEIGEPDLDERPHGVLDSRLPRGRRAPARSSRGPSADRRPASGGCHRLRAGAGSSREHRPVRHPGSVTLGERDRAAAAGTIPPRWSRCLQSCRS